MKFMPDSILRKTAQLLVFSSFCPDPSCFHRTSHFCQDAFQPENEDQQLLSSVLFYDFIRQSIKDASLRDCFSLYIYFLSYSTYLFTLRSISRSSSWKFVSINNRENILWSQVTVRQLLSVLRMNFFKNKFCIWAFSTRLDLWTYL